MKIFLRRVMQEIQKIYTDIIFELCLIQSSPKPFKDKSDNFPFPRQLEVGNGRYITISKKIDQLIADVARRMRRNYPMKSQFTADDYGRLVRRAFGPALAKIDLHADATQEARSVQSVVEATVSENINSWLSNGGREYAFGCTLFTYKNFDPFNIGPVHFEPREIWLNRKASDGCRARIGRGGRIERFDHQIADGPISKITKRRIIRIWRGEKVKDRKPSNEENYEQNILRTIGDCPYVCSLIIPAFGDKAGQDKALLAARLALMTISLIWEHSSKALNGINLLFDREMRGQSLLWFTADGLIRGSGMTSNMPHAPWTDRGELENYFQQFSDEFRIAGEAINWLIKPEHNPNRSEFLSIITQAMLWFHDGCREIIDIKAVVCFASCMDILASGDGRKAICKLISARLGIDKNETIHRDGFTVENVIEQIYNDARTRFVHGPMKAKKHVWEDKIGHDWSETRRIAELLARICLLSCMKWMASHPNCNDPSQLLKA